MLSKLIDSYPRLRFKTSIPIDETELVSHLIAVVEDASRPLEPRDRYLTAEIFRRLLASSRAMRALFPRPKNRPPSGKPFSVARHFSIRAMRFNAELSRRYVAEVWGIEERTVDDYYNEHEEVAQKEVNGIVRVRVGPTMEQQSDGSWVERIWTRDQVLEAMDLDATDWAKKKIRKSTRSRQK